MVVGGVYVLVYGLRLLFSKKYLHHIVYEVIKEKKVDQNMLNMYKYGRGIESIFGGLVAIIVGLVVLFYELS